MDFPRDFQILAINMVAMLDEKIESDEHFLELMLAGINQGGRQELLEFLDLVWTDDIMTRSSTSSLRRPEPISFSTVLVIPGSS